MCHYYYILKMKTIQVKINAFYFTFIPFITLLAATTGGSHTHLHTSFLYNRGLALGPQWFLIWAFCHYILNGRMSLVVMQVQLLLKSISFSCFVAAAGDDLVLQTSDRGTLRLFPFDLLFI